MDVETRTNIRLATEQRRLPPGEPLALTVVFGGMGELETSAASGPLDLTVEATDGHGDLAAWFDDYWWTEVIERWVDVSVTLHLAETPGALLHPVVLHQMEMVCRVAPRWRIVGHAYRDDIAGDEAIEVLACSPYHEIRIKDLARPDRAHSNRLAMPMSVEEMFGRIRREQARIGASRPVLVRLPAGTGAYAESRFATPARLTDSPAASTP